jgi:hypothetical protein
VEQRVTSRTGAAVFDVVLAQRGATPLIWKQWQPTDVEEPHTGEAPKQAEPV